MKDFTSRSDHADCCLHQLFERQTTKSPHARAILYGDRSLTFEKLNSRANELAHHLQRSGVGPETLIGLFVETSPKAVVAILAILKAGGAYVPLDTSNPAARLKQIIDESELRLILTDSTLEQMLPSDTATICLDRLWPGLAAESSENPHSSVTPSNAAYVMYTSGSSGKPKGVIRIHRGLINRFPWSNFLPDEVCSLNFSLSVGFSFHRLFLPLVTGIPLVLLPDHVVKNPNACVAALEGARVTNAAFVPSALDQIVSLGPAISSRLSCLRTVTVGGSRLSQDLITSFKDLLPKARLFNQYGSTETGPIAFGELADSADPKSMLALEVIPNTRIHILDDNQSRVSVGETGELYVGGPQIARGYLLQPSLTKERFTELLGSRVYRTGDLVRCLANGRIEIVGRVDTQVKIRGFRVETGEVETVLRAHHGVREVAVTTEEAKGEKKLVAYLVMKAGNRLSVAEIRDHALAYLPGHMVPAIFYLTESLPYTMSGKLDKTALPRLECTRPDLSSPYRAPRNQTESMIIDLWADLLNVRQIGILDRFLELGGDSLIAMQVILQIRDRLGVDLPPELLFDANISEVCEWLSANTPQDRDELQVDGNSAEPSPTR